MQHLHPDHFAVLMAQAARGMRQHKKRSYVRLRCTGVYLWVGKPNA